LFEWLLPWDGAASTIQPGNRNSSAREHVGPGFLDHPIAFKLVQQTFLRRDADKFRTFSVLRLAPLTSSLKNLLDVTPISDLEPHVGWPASIPRPL